MPSMPNTRPKIHMYFEGADGFIFFWFYVVNYKFKNIKEGLLKTEKAFCSLCGNVPVSKLDHLPLRHNASMVENPLCLRLCRDGFGGQVCAFVAK